MAALHAHTNQTGHLGEEPETGLRGWSGGTRRAAGQDDGLLAEEHGVALTA